MYASATSTFLPACTAGVATKCFCSQESDSSASNIGKWYNGTVDATNNSCRFVDSNAFNKSLKCGSIAGNVCNPITDTFIDSPIPVVTFGNLLSNLIRLFFFIAGLVALVMLLLGALEWISSGGDEKKIESARNKIQAAFIGLVVMVAVITLVVVIEQVVFGGKVCLGISCPLQLGDISLIKGGS